MGKQGLSEEIARGVARYVIERWPRSSHGKLERDGERGRSATTPQQIPKSGWKDIFWRVVAGVQRDRVLLVAAGVAFFALLALFPAIGSIVSVYGLFADPGSIDSKLASLAGVIPDGALTVIGDQIKLITKKGSTAIGFAFIFGLLLSVWGANAGTKSIFDALNIIYKEEEKRSFFVLTLQSLLFTFGAVVLLCLAAAMVVILPAVLGAVGFSGDVWTSILIMARWLAMFAVVMIALACLYRFGPSRVKPQWKWVTLGSLVAAFLWLLGSLAFSWYAGKFGSYNATYGSLGAVIGFMTWLWLSAVIILIGAEINAEVEHQTAQDTTASDDEKPLGARGATMADSVGKITR